MTLPRHGPQRLTSCLRKISGSQNHARFLEASRSFSSTQSALEGEAVESTSDKNVVPAAIVSPSTATKDVPTSSPRLIGSRRRRAALKSSLDIPFEQLPYQCFQEARKILQADRQEKLAHIAAEREKIKKLEAKDVSGTAEALSKRSRLGAMQKYLEELKILADINDPAIKKRFEDGEGDMNRPVYRHLAEKEWRSYRRRVQVQRITQMSVVPDVLPHFDPVADVRLALRQRTVHPGDFVDSRVSMVPARLRVQVFDKGERLVSIVVVDSDVPDVETDQFGYRCHFIAANIAISPTTTSIPLSLLSRDTQIILPWLPPYAQKGSPYHRLTTFVVQQQAGKALDAATLRDTVQRDGFNFRSFIDKHSLKPVGAHLFRTKWDEGMAEVMNALGVEGADVELRRKRVEPLKKMPLPLKKKENRPGLASKRL